MLTATHRLHARSLQVRAGYPKTFASTHHKEIESTRDMIPLTRSLYKRPTVTIVAAAGDHVDILKIIASNRSASRAWHVPKVVRIYCSINSFLGMHRREVPTAG